MTHCETSSKFILPCLRFLGLCYNVSPCEVVACFRSSPTRNYAFDSMSREDAAMSKSLNLTSAEFIPDNLSFDLTKLLFMFGDVVVEGTSPCLW